HVARVGVFVSPEPVEVQAAISAASLDAVQIHGSDSPELYSALPVQTICALNLPPGSQLRDAETQAAGAGAIVFDSHAPGLYGGTGRLSDWLLARELAARLTLILAGGLNPDNVRDAVEQVKPWAVDVNSGVEAAPGEKDPEKLERFFHEIKDYRGDRDADNPPGFLPA
ncbi:MAG TPA: phosphoribosylanthranilate isomerase, partial [Bacteroidetes bacterium]|nr:phosphoribosylanthranilate isomerase [Bacteroidota bacterium]